jgi:hypothetical protein
VPGNAPARYENCPEPEMPATGPMAAHFIAFNGRWTRIGTLLLLNFLRDHWSNIEQ